MSQAEDRRVSHSDEPNFDEIVSELKSIQQKVDKLLFGSVFLRLPNGITEEKMPQSPPENVHNLTDTLNAINETLQQSEELEDRLKEQLDNKNQYEDQLEDYLRDLEEASKTLKALKPILTPEQLRDGEPGKTDVSWLSWRRNTLGTKLHKEMNDLQEIDADDREPSELEAHLNTLKSLIQTANQLLQSAQYLSWFTRRVVDFNESLPEFERDFTVNLVSQWVQEEASKVLEHHKNCTNLQSEIEQKLEAKRD